MIRWRHAAWKKRATSAERHAAADHEVMQQGKGEGDIGRAAVEECPSLAVMPAE